MRGYQFDLFRSFTCADQRCDVHTSVCAMLRDFVEQMDTESIGLMLNEAQTLSNLPKAEFLSRLQRAFSLLQMVGNTQLESAQSNCSLCYPTAAGFIFRGVQQPLFICLIFLVRDGKVVDVHDCLTMHYTFPELNPLNKIGIDNWVAPVIQDMKDNDDAPF